MHSKCHWEVKKDHPMRLRALQDRSGSWRRKEWESKAVPHTQSLCRFAGGKQPNQTSLSRERAVGKKSVHTNLGCSELFERKYTSMEICSKFGIGYKPKKYGAAGHGSIGVAEWEGCRQKRSDRHQAAGHEIQYVIHGWCVNVKEKYGLEKMRVDFLRLCVGTDHKKMLSIC